MNRPLSETETVAIGLLKQYNNGGNQSLHKVTDKWAALFAALVNDGHAVNFAGSYYHCSGPILKDHPYAQTALESLRATVAEQTKARDAARTTLELKQDALDKATSELEALQQAVPTVESK